MNPFSLLFLSTYFSIIECQYVYFTKNNGSLSFDENVELDEEIQIIDLENVIPTSTIVKNDADTRRKAVTVPMKIDKQQNEADFDYSYDEDTRVFARDGDGDGIGPPSPPGDGDGDGDGPPSPPGDVDGDGGGDGDGDVDGEGDDGHDIEIPDQSGGDEDKSDNTNEDRNTTEGITGPEKSSQEAKADSNQTSNEKISGHDNTTQENNKSDERNNTNSQNGTNSDSDADDGDSYSDEVTQIDGQSTGTGDTESGEKDEDKYEDRRDEQWYLDFRDRHNLPEPYQLPTSKRVPDLEDLVRFCRCPRVYWPTCAKNGLTYMNVCVMKCLHQDLKRYGPCIVYRRSRSSYTVKISLL